MRTRPHRDASSQPIAGVNAAQTALHITIDEKVEPSIRDLFRTKIKADVTRTGVSLEPRLHGPAGLDIGGRGPAPIALSIVAQMQQVLTRT